MKTPPNDQPAYDTTTANYALLNALRERERREQAEAAKKITVRKPRQAQAAALGLLVMLAALLIGCAQTRSGILREQAVYQSGTNTLHFVTADIAPLIPSPYSGLFTAVTGLVGAGLAAWNLSQQKRLAALEAQNPTAKSDTGAPIANKPS
jgi:hypothetical protein